MNLIISKLDTNNVDYRFVLVYYIKLLRHLPFRRRGLVNFPLLEKLYQKISKDEEFKKSLGSPIVSSRVQMKVCYQTQFLLPHQNFRTGTSFTITEFNK